MTERASSASSRATHSSACPTAQLAVAVVTCQGIDADRSRSAQQATAFSGPEATATIEFKSQDMRNLSHRGKAID